MNGTHGTPRPVTVPIVENDLRREMAAVAAETGQTPPTLEVVDEPSAGVVAADNGDEQPDGEPWVQVRPKLAAAPQQVRRWAFAWAIAKASLPARPAWARHGAEWCDRIATAGLTTAIYNAAAVVAMLVGAPVRWLVGVGLSVLLLLIATHLIGHVVLARHERRRTYAADRTAASHGQPIPTQAGTWLHEPGWTGPFTAFPGLHARRRRLPRTTPTQAKGDQA